MSKMIDILEKIYSEGSFIPQRYIANADDVDDDNPDNWEDFPFIDDPNTYVTHRPIEQKIHEQDDEKIQDPKKDVKADTADEKAMKDIDTKETPDVGDMSTDTGDIGAGMGDTGDMSAGMDAMGQPEEEKLSSTQLGRVYELKKIYSRLTSVQSFLSRTIDKDMLEIRKMVSQGIDLFELVISNYDQYKEDIDEIIVTYYEFLKTTFGSLKKYFAENSKEQ